MNQARIKELFGYHPDGYLTLATSRSYKFPIGSKAGALNIKGYVHARCDGKKVLAHRLIWVWHNGPIPEGLQIDHINGVRNDNRIENLQLLTPRQNVAKGKAACKPGNLPTGVSLSANRQRFSACIEHNRKNKHLGIFDTAEEASAAYQLALEAIT